MYLEHHTGKSVRWSTEVKKQSSGTELDSGESGWPLQLLTPKLQVFKGTVRVRGQWGWEKVVLVPLVIGTDGESRQAWWGVQVGGRGSGLGYQQRASQVALVAKKLPTNAGEVRHGFNPWVLKISWRRVWQPTPVFLPGESHGQRSLMDYSPWGYKKADTTE